MLIGSLVELHVGLHSCLCFSHLKKLVLKAGSTPPRYLLNSQLFVKLLKLFHFAIWTASRYLVDRSRKLMSPRQLLDTQWIDRASILSSVKLFLDTSTVNDHFLDSFLDTSQYLDTSRALLMVYIFISSRSDSHFFDLSRSVRTYSSPKHHLSYSKPLPL